MALIGDCAFEAWDFCEKLEREAVCGGRGARVFFGGRGGDLDDCDASEAWKLAALVFD